MIRTDHPSPERVNAARFERPAGGEIGGPLSGTGVEPGHGLGYSFPAGLLILVAAPHFPLIIQGGEPVLGLPPDLAHGRDLLA